MPRPGGLTRVGFIMKLIVQRWFSAVLLAGMMATPAWGHERVVRARTPVRIPDIPGYLTLKCDFHIHTVFSDGSVWPSVRSEEAWREGLDAVAITDHIEYQPHKEDLPTNHNRAYEIARPEGEALNVIVIHGSEVTRSMPPGHLNAIFLEDSDALDVEDWREALSAAQRQGAFVFWNHPGWDAQLKEDGKMRWYDEHTELVEKGILRGIEVANSREVYPEAFAWAMERKLTLMSNSDVHAPVNLDYHVHEGDHRPLTLVFARERTAESIHEALRDRRTAVYADHRLLGEERFLAPIFEGSVKMINPAAEFRSTGSVLVQIHNESEIEYQLERDGEVEGVSFPASLTLPPLKTVVAKVQVTSMEPVGKREVGLPYRVTNMLVAPGRALRVELPMEITVVPNP